MKHEQLLAEWMSLAERISVLDFTLDEHLAELDRIQERQLQIRSEYEQLPVSVDEELNRRLQTLAKEIIELETSNMSRMEQFRSELDRSRRDIQSAKRVKNVYENPYIQGFGYFIDSQK